MITSTLTRPSRASIINPISSCQRRVTFVDDIDIAYLAPPKSRTITLSPLPRRTRTKSKKSAQNLLKINQIQQIKPSQPRSSNQPNQLNQSNQPSQSNEPSQPSQSNQSNQPSQSNQPVQPSQSSQPSQPSQTNQPVQPIQTSIRDTQGLHSSSSLDNSLNQPIADLGVAQPESDPPKSPGPSETSFESRPSSGETPSAVESISQASQSARTNDSSSRLKTQFSTPIIDHLKPITTIITLGRAGYLRGDTVDVHVLTDHTKQIKSLHGVIVTLYRQARVDYYPSLPVINKDDDSATKRRMGLRGISISSSGSFHIYRKLLDQNFSAIIIDDKTMTAEVKTSVSIPEDAFPTISTVPGAMISFKYYVEVICDIQGKLSAYDKYLPTPGASSLNGVRNNASMTNGAHSGFHGWGFIDTEEIKREKSVVCC